MELKVTGLDALRRKLQAQNIKQPAMNGLRKLVFALERLVKEHTVVNTGRLRASIHSQFQGEGATIAPSVNYAEFIEFGTEKMQSRYAMGAMKVLGEGGSFQYGAQNIRGTLDEETKEIANQICINVERG